MDHKQDSELRPRGSEPNLFEVSDLTNADYGAARSYYAAGFLLLKGMILEEVPYRFVAVKVPADWSNDRRREILLS